MTPELEQTIILVIRYFNFLLAAAMLVTNVFYAKAIPKGKAMRPIRLMFVFNGIVVVGIYSLILFDGGVDPAILTLTTTLILLSIVAASIVGTVTAEEERKQNVVRHN